MSIYIDTENVDYSFVHFLNLMIDVLNMLMFLLTSSLHHVYWNWLLFLKWEYRRWCLAFLIPHRIGIIIPSWIVWAALWIIRRICTLLRSESSRPGKLPQHVSQVQDYSRKKTYACLLYNSCMQLGLKAKLNVHLWTCNWGRVASWLSPMLCVLHDANSVVEHRWM